MAFLDREAARIDALVATKRGVLAQLTERCAALINRAVARGIDSKARLTISGIAWVDSAGREQA